MFFDEENGCTMWLSLCHNDGQWIINDGQWIINHGQWIINDSQRIINDFLFFKSGY
jgi:hypothetical protein